MIRAAVLLALLPAAAAAQVAPSPVPAPSASPSPALPAATVQVVLTTAQGPITIAVETRRAPVTAANFLRYVDRKRLDGVVFYRAMKLGTGYGLVQFGTRNDPGRTLPGIAHEPTAQTGLSHVDGTISMAMAKPGTAAGDFFVVIGDLKSMDSTATNPGFAAFGRVVEGMDLIRRIRDMPTSATLGDGVMKGQMLAPTLKILTARRAMPLSPAKP